MIRSDPRIHSERGHHQDAARFIVAHADAARHLAERSADVRGKLAEWLKTCAPAHPAACAPRRMRTPHAHVRAALPRDGAALPRCRAAAPPLLLGRAGPGKRALRPASRALARPQARTARGKKMYRSTARLRSPPHSNHSDLNKHFLIQINLPLNLKLTPPLI